jgi:hypothetical protein
VGETAAGVPFFFQVEVGLVGGEVVLALLGVGVVGRIRLGQGPVAVWAGYCCLAAGCHLPQAWHMGT